MLKIIDGKIYDTATATKICDVTPKTASRSRSDFSHEDTSVYRSPAGMFFIAGEGGARSRWAESVDGGVTGGWGLRLLEEDEARALVETHADAEVYVKAFGDPAIG